MTGTKQPVPGGNREAGYVKALKCRQHSPIPCKIQHLRIAAQVCGVRK